MSQRAGERCLAKALKRGCRLSDEAAVRAARIVAGEIRASGRIPSPPEVVGRFKEYNDWRRAFPPGAGPEEAEARGVFFPKLRVRDGRPAEVKAYLLDRLR